MDENNFSFKNRLKNSSKLSQRSNISNKSLNSTNSNKPNIQNKRTKHLKYFDIYNQIKEEITKNYKDKKNANTAKDLKREYLLDNLYLKNTSQINNFYDKNYSNIEIQGTKDLEGIYKKDLTSQVKNNQNNFIQNMPLKYRNPELNKNCKKVNFTPIPYMPNKELMTSLEKKEFEKAIQKVIFIRKMEYTHAKPPPKSFGDNNYIKKNEKNLGYKINNILKAAKLIQKWYRFIKKIRKNTKKTKNKNRYIKILNEEKCDYNENNQLNKQNLKNSKVENKNFENINIKRNISFRIKEQNNSKNLKHVDIKIKPVNNNCYISKGCLNLLNNSPDIDYLNLIQRKIKNFLKNKNKISPYKIYKKLIQNKNKIENSLNNESINSYEKDLADFLNNSEYIFSKKRIISNINSLQSFHNMTIQNDDKKISNKFFKEQDDNSELKSIINNQIVNYNNDNNFNEEENLLNFSFNSGKNKNKNDNTKIIQIKKDYEKNFYISKNIYYNNTELIVKLTDLQSNIKNYLHKKDKNMNNNIYSENSSEIDDKNNKNNDSIEKKDKTKILKILLNKYNKKWNKEVDNNINIYRDINEEKNKIIKITKKKLAMTLIKIINNHLKEVYNDIYQYQNIYYKRKQILLKIFNNIISKLKRYFYRWSNRPLKLLIYKTKSVKYYNSLFTLNNNIKKLIYSIYSVFISKYFYKLIINYLYQNNIDITNNKMFLFLNNKKKLKLFHEISKNINQKKIENNELNIIEYFKQFENLNNDENDSFEEEEEKESNNFSDN